MPFTPIPPLSPATTAPPLNPPPPGNVSLTTDAAAVTQAFLFELA